MIRVLCVSALAFCACVPGERAEPAGHSTSVDGGSPPDAGPAACDALPVGVTQGQLSRDAGPAGAPLPTLVVMGGGTEVDSASRAFVGAASGGDVLVLRATGSVDTYTPYFFADLGAVPPPRSVTTLRVDDPAASGDPALACRVSSSEALWLAGGDQWDYVGTWNGALHAAITSRANDIAVGGTSAGAMALGGWVFTARLGSVTSAEALMDPTAELVDVAPSPLAHPLLAGMLVDTHFTQRDREGRLLAMASRALGGGPVIAVGLDEETALTVVNGAYRVEGTGSAWFYRVEGPATLQSGQPLGLSGVTRMEKAAGSTGTWPPDVVGDAMAVVAGVVMAP